ncbi:hypothetical protein DFJ73DRAFT_5215 [Zopfochytrium polystomum]|nr:hypothetical protein DFJ73DRAFT_5215 [Zopfochytrium polystomum]
MDAWTNLLKSLSSRARKSFTHHKDHPSYSAHHRIALHLRTRTFVAAIQAVFHAAVTSTAESQPVDASELVSVADLEACMSAAQALLQTVDSILGNIEAVAVSAEMENVVKSVRSIGRPRESVVRTSSVTSAPFVDETLSRSGDISRLVQVVDTGPRRDIAASCFEAVDSVKTLLKVVEQALEDANVRPVAASPVPSSLLTQELGNLDNRRLSLQSPLTMESTLVGSPTVSDSGLPYSESTFDFIPEELRPFLPDDPARDLSFGGLKNDSPLQRRLAKGIPASDGKVVRSGTLPMFVARMTTFYFNGKCLIFADLA